ncbi:PyrE-like protein [Dirofilaria immitis]
MNSNEIIRPSRYFWHFTVPDQLISGDIRDICLTSGIFRGVRGVWVIRYVRECTFSPINDSFCLPVSKIKHLRREQMITNLHHNYGNYS